MSSRGSVIILATGVGGLFAFGFLTKLVIDSRPDLQNIIRFKAALAQDFGEKGICEVQLRKEQRQSYRLSLTLSAERSASEKESGFKEGGLEKDEALARLDGEIAEYFLKNFPERSARVLRISYFSPGTSGCQGSSEFRTKEVALDAFRKRLSSQSHRAPLEERFRSSLSCRLVLFEQQGPELQIGVEAPPGFAGDARQLAVRLEGLVREEFRSGPYGILALRILPAGEQVTPPKDEPRGKCLLEARFDFRGRELRG